MEFWNWFPIVVGIPIGFAINLYTPAVRRWFTPRTRPLFAGAWVGTVRYLPGRPYREDRYEVAFHGTDAEVGGTLTCTRGSDSGRQLTVEGTFRNDVLSLIYSPPDALARDRGTLVLRYTDDVKEKRLIGKATFWSDTLGEVDVAEVELTLRA